MRKMLRDVILIIPSSSSKWASSSRRGDIFVNFNGKAPSADDHCEVFFINDRRWAEFFSLQGAMSFHLNFYNRSDDSRQKIPFTITFFASHHRPPLKWTRSARVMLLTHHLNGCSWISEDRKADVQHDDSRHPSPCPPSLHSSCQAFLLLVPNFISYLAFFPILAKLPALLFRQGKVLWLRICRSKFPAHISRVLLFHRASSAFSYPESVFALEEIVFHRKCHSWWEQLESSTLKPKLPIPLSRGGFAEQTRYTSARFIASQLFVREFAKQLGKISASCSLSAWQTWSAEWFSVLLLIL